MQDQAVPHFKVVIIGAGFAGLGMGIRLKQAGEDSFVIFEKEARAGGTWWVNQYPGCACDVPSPLYSFSFEPYPDWPRLFAEQPDILAYLERCVEKYRLGPHLRLATEVKQAALDQEAGLWRIVDGDGGCITARYVVSAMGALSVAKLPDIPGLDTFQGSLASVWR